MPTRALGETVVDEWLAQGEKLKHETMPMTQLALTALDIIGKKRETTIAELTAYANSDLLCHFADLPPALSERQRKIWQPILDWCALRFDALLLAKPGIMPIAQSPDSKAALRRAITSFDDFRLTGLRQAVDLCGSLVLGLALIDRHLTAAQVFNASELEALFQMEKWGEDPDILIRQAGIKTDLAQCEKWFSLLD